MPSLAPLPILTEQEYLESEPRSPVKREYVAGRVFARVGVSRTHNRVTMNIASALQEHLRGGPCQVFFADIRVRVQRAQAYYYPDVVVTCDPEDRDEYQVTRPVLIVEVLSSTTEAIDRREKLLAYQTLDSLKEYVLVSQERRRVEVVRRGEDLAWWQEIAEDAEGDQAEIRLESVGLSLTLGQIYEGISA
jgi:Uma2 family endonuclease